MQCITTLAYNFNINGYIEGEVKPSFTRGIRQGDPLSSYIILLYVEGLSRLLNQAELCGDIQGLSLSRGGPTIIIYFFADDSFIFCNANIQNAQKNSEIKEITTMLSNFRWGHDKDKRKMHFEKWEILCSTKSKRGIGFRELKSFNQALLAKLAWRILTQEDSLLFRILKSKYFPPTAFLKDTFSSTSSWIWKSIIWGRDLLQRALDGG
uniref:Uncharacterized protein n=1 Tax=Solanum lycopersicum TaxID=4081 RepID=A0A3Q7HJI9_SOLLC